MVRPYARRMLGLGAALALTLGGPGQADDNPRHAAVEVGTVDAVPHGPSVAERLAEIRRRIQAATVYPPIARRQGLAGTAHVRFQIGRDGIATGIEASRSSGHWILDRAAERSVRSAGRLPWVYGRLEVPVRFELEPRR
ncbi:MAG: energy transducer TonB [Deltaproteobacteria bacterium]|nr:MAG: energy transducer TonB [Deltaproteobacteria bacterium]